MRSVGMRPCSRGAGAGWIHGPRSAIHALRAHRRRPALHRPRPHWGYLSRTVSRYGVVSSRLVIYSPDATVQARRWAGISRSYGAVAGGAALLAWIGLSAVGVLPLVAILLILALVVPVGIVLAQRTRQVRRRAVTVVASCAVLLGDESERDDQRRLDSLAAALQEASSAYRRGELDERGFSRVWRTVYAHAAG